MQGQNFVYPSVALFYGCGGRDCLKPERNLSCPQSRCWFSILLHYLEQGGKRNGEGGCVEFAELEPGQTVPIGGKTRGMLLWTGLGWTGHPGAQPLDSLWLFLMHCRYIYIPQGFLWIIRCLFCFQFERPFRGEIPFTIHLTAVDFMDVIYKGGKNGVGAWSWLTAAVNLTQALKRNNEWWGRCSPILSLSVEAFQLVNSALTFFMCCWKANTWFCSMRTSWNRCQMKPD